MKKVVLISGLAKKLPDVIDADLIGVDHGASVIAQAGVTMKAAIGDFDSVDGTELKAIAEHAVRMYNLKNSQLKKMKQIQRKQSNMP